MTKNNLKIIKSHKNQETETKEKNKALEAAISQIDENFGKGSVMKLGQKTALDIESISTGSLSLESYRNLWSGSIWKNNFSFTSSW